MTMHMVLLVTILFMTTKHLIVAQNAISFAINDFGENSKRVAFSKNAAIDPRTNGVQLTYETTGARFCRRLVCLGKVYYRDYITIPNGKALSFSASFIFSMVGSRPGQMNGDGLVFFLTSNPTSSNNNIGQFGMLTTSSTSALGNPIFAVEFDSMKNVELADMDDNHVGVNVNRAISSRAVSANTVNVRLNGGQKIIAWIDYDKSENNLQVRMDNYSESTLKPSLPLLNYNLDLSTLLLPKTWVGFSSLTPFGFEQIHTIFSWTFNSNFDAPATGTVPVAPAPRNATDGKKNWRKFIAYAIGGTVIIGGGLWLVIRYTECGRKYFDISLAKLKKFKILPQVERLKKRFSGDEKDSNEDKEDSDGEDEERPPKPTDNEDQDDDADEEDSTPPPPPPPPPPNEDESEDTEDDDDDDNPPPPPPTPPPPPSWPAPPLR